MLHTNNNLHCLKCCKDCEIFDMTALLRMVNNVPYLLTFYNNPKSQYQHQILNQTRAYTVWNKGVRQVVYDKYYDFDMDIVSVLSLFSLLPTNIQNVMIAATLKIVHYDKSLLRKKIICVYGTVNVGKTWPFSKGLTTHSPIQYQELCQPAFYCVADNINTQFEDFKNILGGQLLSVPKKKKKNIYIYI